MDCPKTLSLNLSQKLNCFASKKIAGFQCALPSYTGEEIRRLAMSIAVMDKYGLLPGTFRPWTNTFGEMTAYTDLRFAQQCAAIIP
jgi:hypothetical protein